MERVEIDRLVRRLVENPHDAEALASAHASGETNPQQYATLLERIGVQSRMPAVAAHWLTLAANVWATTIGDSNRAEALLLSALETAPSHDPAHRQLAELYRQAGNARALAATLERHVELLARSSHRDDPAVRTEIASAFEELGTIALGAPLNADHPATALRHFERAIELDPASAYALFHAREIYKQLGRWSQAVALYAPELALEQDPARRVALLRDEALSRKNAGDYEGATRALLAALDADPHAADLQEQFASHVLESVRASKPVSSADRDRAANLFAALARVHAGEDGAAYASAAVELQPNLAPASQTKEAYERDGRYAQALALASAPPTQDALPSAETNTLVRRDRIDQTPAGRARDDVYHASFSAPVSGPPVDRLQATVDAAQMLALKGKKAEALVKFNEVLAADPSHAEALAWTEDYLRAKRDYAQLRDVLAACVQATANVPAQLESRKQRLREIAGLSESHLRDLDSAISAWRLLLSLDRSDDGASAALGRVLEKAQRWDELASLLEQQATSESDIERKVALEKKLAKLHEDKRKDLLAAGESWSRISQLRPDDAAALTTAAHLFERAERVDLAADLLSEGIRAIEDPVSRGPILLRLGALREQLGMRLEAGHAYALAAETTRNAALWDEAERLYAATEAFEQAANAATQRAMHGTDAKQRAASLARASAHLRHARQYEDAIERARQAAELDPLSDTFAEQLIAQYKEFDRTQETIAFLTHRGNRIIDRAKRIAVRRSAAQLAQTHINDRSVARDIWLTLLEDGDDREALEHLIDDAIASEDFTEAMTLLRRLEHSSSDNADKARAALREADLLAYRVGDSEAAIARYEDILGALDPTCRPALAAVAELQQARGALNEAADALERELKLVADITERGQIAARLAVLYDDSNLNRPESAIRALDLVRKAGLDDLTTLERLSAHCERTEQWQRVAELTVERIDIEVHRAEVVKLTQKLAWVLAEKLQRPDDALAALTDLADQGDASTRDAFVDLADRLGWKALVATKLRQWWIDARHTDQRTHALRGAFARFAEVGRDSEAVAVGIELAQSKGADYTLAEALEGLAIKTGDLEALAVAHELLARAAHGEARGIELVRQGEVRAQVGIAAHEAIAHAELGLALVAPRDAEPLIDRISRLASKPSEVVDLYERQMMRAKAPSDRLFALGRAAQVAAARGQQERAQGFFELALSTSASDETLEALEKAAREGDQSSNSDRLRRSLAQALARSGHGQRDAGATRAKMLRHAADITFRQLHDVEQAFAWLAESLVAHVEPVTLDRVEALAVETGDFARAQATLTHALGEVFDGPLVRQLLARRATIRLDYMHNATDAAADLRKLHDLSPQDPSVMNKLASLLMTLGDYSALVQLYEDQILRGRDKGARASFARTIARIWEEKLSDAREAADAWRRVLRLCPGDTEGSEGLERAKRGTLKAAASDDPTQWMPPAVDGDHKPSSQQPPADLTDRIKASSLATPASPADPLAQAAQASSDQAASAGFNAPGPGASGFILAPDAPDAPTGEQSALSLELALPSSPNHALTPPEPEYDEPTESLSSGNVLSVDDDSDDGIEPRATDGRSSFAEHVHSTSPVGEPQNMLHNAITTNTATVDAAVES